MTSDKHNFEELLAPSATARQLHISVATLRKYSLIVERITGKSDYYARNKQRARLYSKQDVQDLDDFHKLAQNNGLTLQEAARQIYAVSDKDNELNSTSVKDQEVMTTPQAVKLLNALQQTISQQNTAIKDLQAQLSRIEEQNKELLAKQDQLQQPKDEQDFSALPDISGIVSEDDEEESAPLQTMQEEKPLTKEEKRAQVELDEAKSSQQLHEEILSKAKENAQKRAEINGHRTLQDMQLEPEKKHWWQRFINM
ncbi:transcriptional regulator [Lactobacillus sp. ESL0701]|uniref:transcriptional regulator n=1 Tax=Lactobacillus sp. ESL0701 TaxID=2983217 RepID=UPI0023F64246|nr:transcriptional regulator [Lactobacillus sp. ESL0701]MDF7672826.1 transcriptional regulator [Lactobacillus sp. ESL0701]